MRQNARSRKTLPDDLFRGVLFCFFFFHLLPSLRSEIGWSCRPADMRSFEFVTWQFKCRIITITVNNNTGSWTIKSTIRNCNMFYVFTSNIHSVLFLLLQFFLSIHTVNIMWVLHIIVAVSIIRHEILFTVDLCRYILKISNISVDNINLKYWKYKNVEIYQITVKHLNVLAIIDFFPLFSLLISTHLFVSNSDQSLLLF